MSNTAIYPGSFDPFTYGHLDIVRKAAKLFDRVYVVIGVNTAGKTVVSARSLGAVNVQVIMEKFGGGGHLTMAAAQMDTPKEEVAEKIINIMEEYLNDSHS